MLTIYNACGDDEANGEVLIQNPNRPFGLAVRTLPMSLSFYITQATWKRDYSFLRSHNISLFQYFTVSSLWIIKLLARDEGSEEFK